MQKQKSSQQSFQQRVYTFVKLIPKGKITTYGQIAKMAGSPNAARAVGQCMKNNPDQKIIPCHRVVSSSGKLTGYAFGGISVKKELLLKEGVSFLGKNVNLNISQWRTD